MSKFRVYYLELLKKYLNTFVLKSISSTWYLKYFAQL